MILYLVSRNSMLVGAVWAKSPEAAIAKFLYPTGLTACRA